MIGNDTKYLVLDLDGVLNNATTFPRIDPMKVALLNDIDASTSIVISSAWREHHPLGELKTMLTAHGLRDASRVIDCTPLLGADATRGAEIAAWMTAHHVTSTRIAILDDRTDMQPLLSRLVLTTFEHGLQSSHVRRINELLS